MKKTFKETASEIGDFVENKNENYGNSFHLTENFLKLLYPNGINKDQYYDLIFSVRMFDKLKVISTQKNSFNEKPLSDILGLVIRRIDNNE